MYSTSFLILTFIKYNYTLINFLTKSYIQIQTRSLLVQVKTPSSLNPKKGSNSSGLYAYTYDLNLSPNSLEEKIYLNKNKNNHIKSSARSIVTNIAKDMVRDLFFFFGCDLLH